MFCPACSQQIHRSRVRNRWEEIRRLITGRRPFRCHGCSWRGWRKELKDEGSRTWAPATSNNPEDARRTELDLDALDDSLRRAQKRTAVGPDQVMIE
jgi:hypothetical protein